jgi:hypothetical protein
LPITLAAMVRRDTEDGSTAAYDMDMMGEPPLYELIRVRA